MKRVPMLILVVCLPLAACGGLKPVGGQQIPAPDASITAPCPRAETFLGVRDWEIMAGRLGDELNECGAEKAVLVQRDNDLRRAIGK